MSRRNRRLTTASRASATSTDLSPVALTGSGLRGEVTSWNHAATLLLGWQPIDVVGRPLTEVLACDIVARPGAGAGVTRVRAQVISTTGVRLDVDVLVDGELNSQLPSGESLVALVPIEARLSLVDAGASPQISSWADAARVIRGVGGVVQCILIGLVGVEAVNRGYSRSTGDVVLREVARRLEAEVGLDASVLRLSGNQFVVATSTAAGIDASRLLAIVSQPVDTRLGRVRIGGYVGSIVGDSGSGLIVLHLAELAMRHTRERGIGAVECLDVVSQHTSPCHPRLSSLLIDAVARNEITVAFQPVVELSTGQIVEFEALARWTSGEMGEVEPMAFIQAAEEAGLIHQLGEIVLEKSLDIVRAEVLAGRWGARRMSVNLSAVQLMHPGLVTRVLEALSSRRLPGAVLQLELTETRPILDMAIAAATLSELHQHGVRVAIDDFGTGYANMAYLRDLPVDAIKVAGRFIAGAGTSPADTAVVRSMVSLATELRLDVIAEGVETVEQHLGVVRVGCIAAQGYLYATERDAAHLFDPIELPGRRPSAAVPYPMDEARRVAALHRADILDTPAEEVYDEFVRAAAELCGAPISLVTLIDEDRQWFKAKVGTDVDQTPRDFAFCAHAICSDTITEVPDTLDDDRFVSNPLVVDDPNIRFYAGAPLRTAAGFSYGTLCVLDTVPRLLTPEQRDGLARLARQVTVLLELRESVHQLSHANRELELAHAERDAVEARLQHEANYDVLTGLPNRALLMQRIDQAFATSRRTGQPFAMLICDLDNFKLVNDGLGHPAGDQLLVEVARRLQSCMRETDTVARFGGDEFVIVANNADEATVAMLTTRILDEMTAPLRIGGQDDFRPSISIGLAIQTPGVTGDDLLSNADVAMYQAKSMGGAQMCAFDAALRADVVDRLTLGADLRTALAEDELFCVHRPAIDLVSGDLFGLESRVRWQHPKRGTLLPEKFLPMLETTTANGALFERVLGLTLAAQARWAADSGRRPAVAVNLSARQLHDPGLAGTIRTALERFSTPPELLWLEVTEGALASTATFDTLHEIQQSGVHLAIDNFGVGWSSMGLLSMFPWELLKIDRSFIERLGCCDNTEQVVQGIVSLAHAMGMRASAEGVETVEQLDLLRKLGCDIVQGNLVDRPLFASEVSQRFTPATGRSEPGTAIGWYACSKPSTIHGDRSAFNSSSCE